MISTAKQSCNSQQTSSFQQFFHKPLSSFVSAQQVLQATSGKSSFPLTASKSKLWPDFCAGLKTGKGLLLLDFVVFYTSDAFVMPALTRAGSLCAYGCSDQFCAEWLRFQIWCRLQGTSSSTALPQWFIPTATARKLQDLALLPWSADHCLVRACWICFVGIALL